MKENTSKRDYIKKRFNDLGITIKDMAEIVVQEQITHNPWLTQEIAEQAVERVIAKREVQHALVTALSIDELAERNALPIPLQYIIEDDNSQYGIDESIALSTSMLYGTIASSNFGELDKKKPGIIGVLNDGQKSGKFITTMTDDMISAIIASAEGKISQNVHLDKE